MNLTKPEELMQRLAHALRDVDWDALGEVFAPDATLEYPQSGELFRGLANIRAQFENYPDLDPGGSELQEVIGESTAYALTPTYQIIGVEGTGNRGTAIIKVRYPDGSRWYAVNVFEVRDGLISRSRTYFAPEFDAPDWRAPYREDG